MSSDPMEIDGRYVALEQELARYREAVGVAVKAIEAQKRWNDEGWCRLCEDLFHALAALKGLRTEV